MIHRLVLRSFARTSFACLVGLMPYAGGCGDGDVIADGGLSTQDAASVSERCGDGVVSPSEQCDDGNTNAGDGCSGVCARETAFAATPGASDAGALDAASSGGSGSIDAASAATDAGNAAADATTGNGPQPALDAGADAGASDPDASSGEDSGGPTAPEPLCPAEPAGECEACNCTMCRSELDACTNLAGNASEGPAMGTPKAALCEALVRCGRTSGCRSLACVCSAETQTTCLGGQTPPDGPCHNEVLSAAETTDMNTFLTRATSPAMGYAVAAASAVSACAANACASACAAP